MLRAAFRTVADGIIARLNEQSIRLGIKLKGQLPGVLDHEPLRFRFGRAEIPTPAVNAKLCDRLSIRPDGFQLGVFAWVLVHAVVAERREAEIHPPDVAAVGMPDESAKEIVANVRVVGVVLPGNGEIFLPASNRPLSQDDGVRPVVRHAVNHVPARFVAEREIAAWKDVIAWAERRRVRESCQAYPAPSPVRPIEATAVLARN